MPVPTMTAEQRASALKKAGETRQAQAKVLEAIRSGRTTLPKLLKSAKTDPVAGKMKITQLLRAVPGMGPARTAKLMEEIGIDPTRRAAGLGERQRALLIKALG